VVLDSKLEICQCNGNKGRYSDEDDEHNEQDAVDGVDFVTPNACKNVIELDVDCTEWQKTCHAHLSPQRRKNEMRSLVFFMIHICSSINIQSYSYVYVEVTFYYLRRTRYKTWFSILLNISKLAS
jgi:hypothetical protein